MEKIAFIKDRQELERLITEIGAIDDTMVDIAWQDKSFDYKQNLIRYILVNIGGLQKEITYWLNPEGLSTLSICRSSLIPINIWNLITLSFDNERGEFDTKILLKRLEN